MIYLLLQDIPGAGIPPYLAALFALATAIATFAVAYVYFRSGLQERQTGGYQKLLEIEEKRTAKLTAEIVTLEAEKKKLEERETRLNDRVKYLEQTNAELDTDYTALSQLFSKKSVILEIITGRYAQTARLLESGSIEEALQFYAPGYLEEKKKAEEIHNSRPPTR